jgi:hypothetical protein
MASYPLRCSDQTISPNAANILGRQGRDLYFSHWKTTGKHYGKKIIQTHGSKDSQRKVGGNTIM